MLMILDDPDDSEDSSNKDEEEDDDDPAGEATRCSSLSVADGAMVDGESHGRKSFSLPHAINLVILALLCALIFSRLRLVLQC